MALLVAQWPAVIPSHSLDERPLVSLPAEPCSAVTSQHQTLFRVDKVRVSRSVVSDSLRPREMQHARPPC